MNKLTIIYKDQKEPGNFYLKKPNKIYIKPKLKKEFEAEVLMHEFIHYLSYNYRCIPEISEDRVMKLGKRFLKILKN